MISCIEDLVKSWVPDLVNAAAKFMQIGDQEQEPNSPNPPPRPLRPKEFTRNLGSTFFSNCNLLTILWSDAVFLVNDSNRKRVLRTKVKSLISQSIYLSNNPVCLSVGGTRKEPD